VRFAPSFRDHRTGRVPDCRPRRLLARAGDGLDDGEFARIAQERITACISGRQQSLQSVDVTFACPSRHVAAMKDIWSAMQPDVQGKLGVELESVQDMAEIIGRCVFPLSRKKLSSVPPWPTCNDGFALLVKGENLIFDLWRGEVSMRLGFSKFGPEGRREMQGAALPPDPQPKEPDRHFCLKELCWVTACEGDDETTHCRPADRPQIVKAHGLGVELNPRSRFIGWDGKEAPPMPMPPPPPPPAPPPPPKERKPRHRRRSSQQWARAGSVALHSMPSFAVL
jgi:hypothetical protein